MEPERAPQHFDLIIIGTGSGNTILDPRFEDWDVAIVERDLFGGTCTNRGCIPTKMLVYPADVAHSLGDAGTRRGRRRRSTASAGATSVTASSPGSTASPSAASATAASQDHVTVFGGDAHFIGDADCSSTVESTVDTRSPPTASCSPPARVPPSRPVPGLRRGAVRDVGLDHADRRAAGAPDRAGRRVHRERDGHVFGAYGVDVVIVTRGDRLISHHDADIAEAFTQIYRERFDLRLSVTATSAGHRARTALIDARSSPTDPTCAGDMLLLATGRTPNGDQLQVAVGGIDVHDDGWVVTDDTLATSCPGRVGAGRHDVGVTAQARRQPRGPGGPAQPAASRRSHPASTRAPCPTSSSAIHRSPRWGSPRPRRASGPSERAARVGVGTRRYADTAAGWALEDTTSFCKVVADLDTRLILGAHIIGPWASLLLQPLVQGMRFGLTVDELARMPHVSAPGADRGRGTSTPGVVT